jgi:hypothetical protein
MFVSCECLCCQRSLRRTDPSSRGVLPLRCVSQCDKAEIKNVDAYCG